MVTMLKNKCSVWKRIKFPTLRYNLLFYMVRYLFYTIGDLTYQSPLVVWRSLRLVTWNLEGKEARCMGQYLFQYIASHWKTPVPNTLGPRFCSLYTINVCTSRSCWPMSSCQAEIPTHNTCIPYTPSRFQLSLTTILTMLWISNMCERNKLNFVEMLLHWMHVICDKDGITFYLCCVSSNFQSIFFHVWSSVILVGFWD